MDDVLSVLYDVFSIEDDEQQGKKKYWNDAKPPSSFVLQFKLIDLCTQRGDHL